MRPCEKWNYVSGLMALRVFWTKLAQNGLLGYYGLGPQVGDV